MKSNSPSRSFYGAVLVIILAIVLYDVMGAIVKHLSERYSTQELTVFRNLFGLVPAVAILFTSRSWIEAGRPIVVRQWRLAIGRGCIGVLAQMSFYLSLIYMDFATASTLVFAGPLFITALSVPILRHQIGLWRWAAVIIGFVGVMAVLRPDTASLTWYLLLPVCAALGYATTAVTSKLFDVSVPSALINLYYTTAALLGSTILVIATSGFTTIAVAMDWMWLGCMGLVGGLAAFCMTTANRMADPSSLSPFQYFGIPSSFILGWIFFSETPFDDLIPGVFLIVGGGLLIFWREQKQRPADRRKDSR
ncbi:MULTISPECIES: DMT family transporter [unclassified Roseovarius]|uniref:DMT family transporter n=1 Tax=unclassified Roseovarius TaxID=2614913 RepID=UPI00273FBD64|nr:MULTISPECIES: DMT family transporter [unclassified Roseovarius]